MPAIPVSGKRRDVVEKIAHLSVGFAILSKAIAKAEHFREHPKLSVFLFAAAAFVLIGALFERRLEKRIAHFAKLFHVAEGLALIVVGAALLEKSARMPYFFLFAGLAYLALGGFELLTREEDRQRLAPRFAALMGGAFLLFAAAAVVLNTLASRNAWAYGIAALIALVGGFLLLARQRLFRRP